MFYFVIVRVVAFAMRAALAGSESTAENLNVVIADEALFGIRYFSLIYSAYNLSLFWIGKYYSFKFLNVSEVLIYYFFALKNSSPRSYTTRKSFIENHPESKAFPCGNLGSPYSQARNRFIYNNKLQWLHLGDSQHTTRSKYYYLPGCRRSSSSSDNIPCKQTCIWYIQSFTAT